MTLNMPEIIETKRLAGSIKEAETTVCSVYIVINYCAIIEYCFSTSIKI